MTVTAVEPLVLIVDDARDARELLSELLVASGFNAVTTAEGRVALAIFARRRPCAVILALRLPDMDGLELARRLRAAEPDLPILAYTAAGGNDVEARAKAAGCSCLLVKTTAPAALVATVTAALRGCSQPV